MRWIDAEKTCRLMLKKLLLSGLSQPTKSWPRTTENEHLCLCTDASFLCTTLLSLFSAEIFFHPHPTASFYHPTNTSKPRAKYNEARTYTSQRRLPTNTNRLFKAKKSSCRENLMGKSFSLSSVCVSEKEPTDKNDFVDRAERPWKSFHDIIFPFHFCGILPCLVLKICCWSCGFFTRNPFFLLDVDKVRRQVVNEKGC